MKIHDISLPIFPGMVVWPDDPNVSLRRTLDQSKGDLATVSELALGVHTGTHLDAPLHFVPGGTGVDALALDVLCGPARVHHALDADALTAEVFERMNVPSGTERLLVRTRNAEGWARRARVQHAIRRRHPRRRALAGRARGEVDQRGLLVGGDLFRSVHPARHPAARGPHPGRGAEPERHCGGRVHPVLSAAQTGGRGRRARAGDSGRGLNLLSGPIGG